MTKLHGKLLFSSKDDRMQTYTIGLSTGLCICIYEIKRYLLEVIASKMDLVIICVSFFKNFINHMMRRELTENGICNLMDGLLVFSFSIVLFLFSYVVILLYGLILFLQFSGLPRNFPNVRNYMPSSLRLFSLSFLLVNRLFYYTTLKIS